MYFKYSNVYISIPNSDSLQLVLRVNFNKSLNAENKILAKIFNWVILHLNFPQQPKDF